MSKIKEKILSHNNKYKKSRNKYRKKPRNKYRKKSRNKYRKKSHKKSRKKYRNKSLKKYKMPAFRSVSGSGQDGGAVDSTSNEYTQAQIDNMERGEFDRRKTLHREYGYSPLPNGSDRRGLDLALGTHTGDGGPVFVGDVHMGDVRFQMGALRSHWTMAQQIAQNNDRYHDRYHNFHRRQRNRLIELGEDRVARMRAMRDAGQTTERRAQILQIAGVGAQDTGEYLSLIHI